MEHGCDHYKRRCKLVAPCCGEVFWCRHCHNQVKDDSEQVALRMLIKSICGPSFGGLTKGNWHLDAVGMMRSLSCLHQLYIVPKQFEA
jgi:hypothetical protein